jgi:hypothetical protein
VTERRNWTNELRGDEKINNPLELVLGLRELALVLRKLFETGKVRQCGASWASWYMTLFVRSGGPDVSATCTNRLAAIGAPDGSGGNQPAETAHAIDLV